MLADSRSVVLKELYARAWDASVERGNIWGLSRCAHRARRGRCWLTRSELHADVWAEALLLSDILRPAAKLYKLWIASVLQWVSDRADSAAAGRAAVDPSLPRPVVPNPGTVLSLLHQEHGEAYEVYARWGTRSIEEIVRELKLGSDEDARNLYEAAVRFLTNRLSAPTPLPPIVVQSRIARYIGRGEFRKPVPPSREELERIRASFERRFRERAGRGEPAGRIAAEAGLSHRHVADVDAVVGLLDSLFACKRTGEDC